MPIFIDPAQPEVLGTLTAGLRLDRPLADRIKTHHPQRRGVRRRRPAARLDAAGRRHGGAARRAGRRPACCARRSTARSTRRSGGGSSSRRRGRCARGPRPNAGGPLAIVARSRTAHLAFLRNLHSALGATTAVAVLVATLLSFAVARTVTRPIRALTATMREMATTGVLTRAGRAAQADAVGRRGRAAPDRHLPHADRLARSLPARGGAARAAVVARPPVDGHRARDPQPADDHQGRRCGRCAAASPRPRRWPASPPTSRAR